MRAARLMDRPLPGCARLLWGKRVSWAPNLPLSRLPRTATAPSCGARLRPTPVKPGDTDDLRQIDSGLAAKIRGAEACSLRKKSNQVKFREVSRIAAAEYPYHFIYVCMNTAHTCDWATSVSIAGLHFFHITFTSPLPAALYRARHKSRPVGLAGGKHGGCCLSKNTDQSS